MNLEKNKKTIMQLIVFAVAVIFAFVNIEWLYNTFLYIVKIFMPFIIGAVIAFVLNVLLNLIENKLLKNAFEKKNKGLKKYKRAISLSLSFIGIILLLSLLLFLVVPELKNSVAIFVQNLPEYISNLSDTLANFGVDEERILEITNGLNELKVTGLDFIKNNSKLLLTNSLNIASSLITTITNFVLGTVFAIYILAQKEKLIDQAQKVMKAYLKKDKVEKLNKVFTLSNRVCSNFISGQCMEALIIGMLCFVGMLILRIPYATTISVLIGFTALIPVFGAFIGTIIGSFLILMVSPIKAVIFVVFILILQQFEGNLIYPRVVGKSVGLPGIWVMVAVTVGASIAGIVGMLVSVPLCSIIYSILATNVNLRLSKRK